jgi:hypothetical protein
VLRKWLVLNGIIDLALPFRECHETLHDDSRGWDGVFAEHKG